MSLDEVNSSLEVARIEVSCVQGYDALDLQSMNETLLKSASPRMLVRPLCPASAKPRGRTVIARRIIRESESAPSASRVSRQRQPCSPFTSETSTTPLKYLICTETSRYRIWQRQIIMNMTFTDKHIVDVMFVIQESSLRTVGTSICCKDGRPVKLQPRPKPN